MKDLLNNVFFQASITENGEDQQTIASFSETPGIAQNRKNLENAEEATKDVETEKEIIEKSKNEVRENRNDEREEDVKDRVASNVEHTEEGSEEEPQEEASAADNINAVDIIPRVLGLLRRSVIEREYELLDVRNILERYYDIACDLLRPSREGIVVF